jgi:hypothetical protein
MTRETADAVWGAAAVDHALKEEHPEPVTHELLAEIRRRADPPGAFRAWALAQPWPRFCTIVRVISGVMLDEMMRRGEEE